MEEKEKSSILICDDEPGVRESLKVILEGKYALAFAADGEEAVSSVRRHKPALVILDVKMPRRSGLEVLAEVKQICPAARVLMITGYESADVASQAARLGADGYLTKPFHRATILQQVEALLA